MDFNLTQEQQQFAEAVRRWIEKDYTFEQRQRIVASVTGVSEPAWAALTELGALALPVPEQYGGFDGNAIDMLPLMQELGRGLLVEPYFATIFAAEFLKRSGRRGDLLEQVASGACKLAAALGEQQARHELFNIATRATPTAHGYRLHGKKTVVLHGAQADHYIVSARTSGQSRDQHGISLLIVAADTPGITCRAYRTIDGQRAADLDFDGVEVNADAVLGEIDAGWALLDAVADYGTTLLCAEAIGLMEAINAATLEYLKTRQQFGVEIGKFQVLQHRMTEMFMELEQARSLATLAAVKAASAERRSVVSAAKARVGQAARFVGQQAVQLHGGMGVTNELPVAHMFKRLTMLELTLGDTDHHLARFIAQASFRQTA